MPILAVNYNGMEVQPDGMIDLEMSFQNEKDFVFDLTNTSPTDEIENLVFMTNLKAEQYSVTLPSNIHAGENAKAIVTVKREPLIAMADDMEKSGITQAMTIRFEYARKRRLFV